MKPKVFLSHSKRDKEFIIQIANELRIARIDTWYDDWEIPSGESLRNRIFEDGIPGCDLFFIYLTENSVESYWCQKELDAAFIYDYEKKGGFISLFVSSDTIRDKLPLDLKALRCPTFNKNNYLEGMLQLTSRSWQALIKKKEKDLTEKLNKDLLEAKLSNTELLLQYEKIKNNVGFDIDFIIQQLNKQNVENPYKKLTFKELFLSIDKILATVASENQLEIAIMQVLGLKDITYNHQIENETGKTLSYFLGPLIILNLVTVQPPNTEWSARYYLSDIGKKVSLKLIENNTA